MRSVAAQVASLGPIGRLPPRAASPVADLVGLCAAIVLARLGFVAYAAAAAAILFGAAALAGAPGAETLHPRREPVLGRVAGMMVALGAGTSPIWLAASCAAAYTISGLVRVPPDSWLAGWLPPQAVRAAADVLPAAAVLGLSLAVRSIPGVQTS